MWSHRIQFGLLAALLVTAPIGASACSRTDTWTQQTIFDEAKEVFRARVTGAEVFRHLQSDDGSMQASLVHVRYVLKETIKGRPTETGPVTTTNLYVGGCGVPVVVGLDYLFFIEAFPDSTPDKLKGGSSGLISIFASRSLPQSEEGAEKIIAKVRSYRAPD